ncbi:hypothetical protein CMEL01_02591 [Colletotrichum melonis]|uniref:Uncharacterized protein n=1 Tax=Colletotrichum melonis TaxID=1209925 RepID=A0AAI9XQC0_9PEZI|nr:hypothetical protein CMEL01_02591 [Colletotrichum melonis]
MAPQQLHAGLFSLADHPGYSANAESSRKSRAVEDPSQENHAPRCIRQGNAAVLPLIQGLEHANVCTINLGSRADVRNQETRGQVMVDTSFLVSVALINQLAYRVGLYSSMFHRRVNSQSTYQVVSCANRFDNLHRVSVPGFNTMILVRDDHVATHGTADPHDSLAGNSGTEPVEGMRVGVNCLKGYFGYLQQVRWDDSPPSTAQSITKHGLRFQLPSEAVP